MPHGRSLTWPAGLLLAAPLILMGIWIARGAVSRSFGPRVPAGPPPTLLAGFPPPEADYTPDRLHERVDGAADALRAEGCRRLLYWRMQDPAAEVELLVFDAPGGAARVLARDAGPGRTAGPGDETSAGPQSVYFRRGRFYARILAEPGVSLEPGRLLELAARIDTALPIALRETADAP